MSSHPESDRYSRQERFAPLGAAGQARLGDSTVTLVGCGALGSAMAQMLVRAGVGRLRVIDRDFIELSNLQRHMLFDEDDLAAHLPKAEAAARKLRRINSTVQVEPVVADLNEQSIAPLTAGADIILEGTDNLQTRFLINDWAVKHGVPWVYAACVASRALVMPVRPGGRPCLRCVFEDAPEPGGIQTCETAGIIGPAVNLAAALAVAEGLKFLAGAGDAVSDALIACDLWENRCHYTSLTGLTDGCRCCANRQFDYLGGKGSFNTVSLCGQNAIQLRPRQTQTQLDLAALAAQLQPAGPVTVTEFLLRLTLPGRELTVFPDGRAIIKGAENVEEARSLYARYVGH